MQSTLRVISEGLSVIFHPLLMLTYGLLFLIGSNPYLFGSPYVSAQKELILLIFISSFLIPMIAMSLMKALGMVSSLRLPDREERIGPYIMVGIFYLWLFINVRNQSTIPLAYSVCVLGTVIGLFTGFFINLFDKISIHGIAMGAMVLFAFIVRYRFSYGDFILEWPGVFSIHSSLNYLLPLFVLFAGLVMSARIYLSAHQPKQVYLGFAVGALSMLIASRILL